VAGRTEDAAVLGARGRGGHAQRRSPAAGRRSIRRWRRRRGAGPGRERGPALRGGPWADAGGGGGGVWMPAGCGVASVYYRRRGLGGGREAETGRGGRAAELPLPLLLGESLTRTPSLSFLLPTGGR